jgi:hypothetical protein
MAAGICSTGVSANRPNVPKSDESVNIFGIPSLERRHTVRRGGLAVTARSPLPTAWTGEQDRATPRDRLGRALAVPGLRAVAARVRAAYQLRVINHHVNDYINQARMTA